MTDPQFTFNARTTTVLIDSGILVEGKLHICLMQMGPAIEAIATDKARPAAVAAIRHLLAGGDGHATPALREMVPGSESVVVVAPELAFGSGDWHALDELVRQTDRPLVLITGFGATAGHILLDWKAQDIPAGQTARHFAWDQAADAIGSAMLVNGGWCWIHEPGAGTHCITYLKNVAEQNVEAVELAGLQFGRTITHLQFNDVDLFPLICADLLQPIAQHPDSAQARIHEMLDAAPDAARPAMVIGSLLQHGYNVNWEIAVDALLNQVMVNRRGIVALCNISHDKPVADEDLDRWRSLTGVYGRWNDLPKGQQNLPVGRKLNVRGIVGAVVRRSEPSASTGVVDWGPYGPVDGSFVWHAKMSCPIIPAGLQAPVALPPMQFACEITRFMRRHPPQANWSPRVDQGLALVTGHVTSPAKPDARRILNALLGGVDPKIKSDPDALHLLTIAPAFRAGLHALATMATTDVAEWQADEAQSGQLRLPATDRNILIWRDPSKTPRQMRSDLGAWTLDPSPHPDLIVLGAGPSGGLAEGVVEEERRDDISLSPPPEAELGATGALAASATDITLPRARRNVAALSLLDVDAVYTDYDPAEGDEARMDTLLARINAFFPKQAAA